MIAASERIMKMFENEQIPNVKYIGKAASLLANSRALAEIAKGDYIGAAQELNWAITLDENDVNAQVGLALCFARLEEKERSQSLLYRIEKIAPELGKLAMKLFHDMSSS